ncbi:MAG: hypothetical protein AMJ54_04000 [Deltaproteobacteria bacterium SG8_13]|nr:MAG: hypothetical protein AMJ54_04000 [Deltaproteobacteria bacterium SG8_13]
MNRFWTSRSLFAAFILSALLLVTAPGCAQTSLKRITVGELNAILADQQAVIVDVRDTRDWDSSDQKIKGAIRLDPRNLDPANLPIAKNAALVLY